MRPWPLRWRRSDTGTDEVSVKPPDPGGPLRKLAYEVRQSALRRFYGFADAERPAELCPFARAAMALPDDLAFGYAAVFCELDAAGMSYLEFLACLETHIFRFGPVCGYAEAAKATEAAWSELAWKMSVEAPLATPKPRKRLSWDLFRKAPQASPEDGWRIREVAALSDDLGLVRATAERLSQGGVAAAFALVKGVRAAAKEAATSGQWSLASVAGETVCYRGFLPVPLETEHRYPRAVASFAAESEGLPVHAPPEAVAAVQKRVSRFVMHGMAKALAEKRFAAAADYSVVVGGRRLVLSEALGRADLFGFGRADLLASLLGAAQRVLDLHPEAFVDPGSCRSALQTMTSLAPKGRYVPELALAAIAFGLVPVPGAGSDAFVGAIATAASNRIEPVDLAAARVFDDIARLQTRLEACVRPGGTRIAEPKIHSNHSHSIVPGGFDVTS